MCRFSSSGFLPSALASQTADDLCRIGHPLEKLLPAVTSQSDAVLWKPSRTITQQVCGPVTLILVAGVEKKPLCLISLSLSSAGAK